MHSTWLEFAACGYQDNLVRREQERPPAGVAASL